jgi:hypothetical protein
LAKETNMTLPIVTQPNLWVGLTLCTVVSFGGGGIGAEPRSAAAQPSGSTQQGASEQTAAAERDQGASDPPKSDPPPSDFIVREEADGRITEHKDGFLRLRYPLSDPERVVEPLGLDTAVVRFEPRDRSGPAVTVDLVAAVHVGERAYYKELNRRFDDYDLVLYELLAEDGTVVTPEHAARRDHPVNMVQGGMQDALGLAHQLAMIDYQRDHFVRADMTPTEFLESMRKRDESIAKLLFRMAGNALAVQSGDAGASDIRMLSALMQLRLAMAEQLLQFGGSLPALDGPHGSTLVTERNKKALEGLTKQLKMGKQRIAIFYGAAHMPDMQNRLETDFHLRRTKVEWIEAWNLEEANNATPKDGPRKAIHE